MLKVSINIEIYIYQGVFQGFKIIIVEQAKTSTELIDQGRVLRLISFSDQLG